MIELAIRIVNTLNSRLGLKRLIPARLWNRVRDIVVNSSVRQASDRRYLEETLLPALGRRRWPLVLFVGCEPYTRSYASHFNQLGTEYWTTDIRPEAAAHGQPGRHIVCDVKEIDCHFPDGLTADLVVLNGVFGFGVNDKQGMNQALRAIHRVMKPGGVLLLGWNTDRVIDPGGLVELQKLYLPGADLPLPSRKEFADCTHVFQFYTARAGQDENPPTENPAS
jgi:SAM-dependent methyltransferase